MKNIIIDYYLYKSAIYDAKRFNFKKAKSWSATSIKHKLLVKNRRPWFFSLYTGNNLAYIMPASYLFWREPDLKKLLHRDHQLDMI